MISTEEKYYSLITGHSQNTKIQRRNKRTLNLQKENTKSIQSQIIKNSIKTFQ